MAAWAYSSANSASVAPGNRSSRQSVARWVNGPNDQFGGFLALAQADISWFLVTIPEGAE